jgi:hypothetical protein
LLPVLHFRKECPVNNPCRRAAKLRKKWQ